MSALTFDIAPFGEHGLLATLSGGDMVATALAANAAASQLRATPGVIDAVAGIDSLVIRFRPAELRHEAAAQLLQETLHNLPAQLPAPTHTINIPICYGGAYGPDFDMLCEKLSMTETQLIEMHSGAAYRVLTIGFAPGFAYLGPLPDALHTQRLATPRARVPAGSVGIAGAMTGVYPLETPGGWPLIGRTPKKLFDAASKDPFVFSAGAAMKFTPIDAAAFAELIESKT